MADLLARLARQLVDDPDAVRVEQVEREDATVLELYVAPEDRGKVIGQQAAGPGAAHDRAGERGPLPAARILDIVE